MVTIARQSPFTGQYNEMSFDISPELFTQAYEAWQDGVLIQNAFPMLSAEEREFIKTGITPDEWDNLFNSDED